MPAKASSSGSDYTYWKVFCFNGKDGLRKLISINQLSKTSPDVSECEQYYGTAEAYFEEEEEEYEEVEESGNN